MAEDVGSLVVRVAMENSSFQQGIQNMNRQLRVIQSEFKNATSGLKDHGKGLDGLKAKQEMLGKSIDVQSKLVGKHKDMLKESKDTLSKNAEAQTKLKEKVEAAKNAYEQSKNTLGENNTKTKELKQAYEALSMEYTQNEEILRSNVRAVDNHTARVNYSEARLNSMRREIRETTAEINMQNNKWNILSQRLATIGNGFTKVGKKMSSIGREMTTKISAPIIALGTGAAKAAIDFESAFAGVKKTVTGTKEQFANLEKGITDMSKKLPTSASDIAHVAESAGQLGIQTDNILGFTRTIIDLGNATNLVGEEGAGQLAKFANITSMSQKDFDRLGSTIVALGNNMATTEADIVAMGMRLAGAGHQVGMTEAKIMGLSAALSSVGIEAEAGGSAMSKVMVNMQLAVEQGGQSLNDFAKVSGMSASQFKIAFKQDATSALTAFTKGLSQSEKKGTSAIKVLNDMGITEVRMRDALLRAAGAGDLFNKSINIGTQAWKENTALANEANQRYATTESQLKIVKNKIVDAARSIGQNLLPAVRDIAQKIAEVTKKFSELSPETQKTIVKFAALVAAIGPVVWIGGKIATVIGGITKAFSTVTGAIAVVQTGAVAATPAIGILAKAFTVLTGPVGIAIAAIAALTAGGFALHKAFSEKAIPAMESFSKKAERDSQIAGNAFSSMQNKVTASAANVEKDTGKLSKGTAKIADEFVKLDEKVGQSLTNLRIHGGKLSQNAAKEITGNFKNMSTKIVQEIDKNYSKSYNKMQTFFAKAGGLSEAQQREYFDRLKKKQEFEKNIVLNGQKRIDEIYRKAAADNRKLTTDEENQVNTIRKNNLQAMTQNISKNVEEQKVLWGTLKNETSKLTAEQAVDIVKNSAKSRDKSIADAKKAKDEIVENARYQRDVLGTLKPEEAKAVIDAAEHQYEVATNKAKGMHTEVVMEAEKQAGEHADKVDWEKGEVKSKFQYMDDQVGKYAKSMGKKVKEGWQQINNSPSVLSQFVSKVSKYFSDTNTNIKQKMSNIKTEVKNGWGQVNSSPSVLSQFVSSARNNFENTRNAVNQKMQNTVSTIKNKWNEAVQATKNVGGQMLSAAMEVGKNIVEGIKNGISSLAHTVADAAKSVANQAVTTIKGQLDIHSPSRVMMELGKYTSQGLALGILEDMDKVEKASRLAAQTITDITAGKLSDVKVKTNTNDREIKDRVSRQLNWGVYNKNEYQKYLNFVDKLNKEEVEKSKEYLKEDYENRVKSIEDRIRILKNENSIELQTEKARIDAQIAYYQKLSRNTKDKNTKTNYANQIASLRQYQKSVLNTTKANQKAQINSLERSKRALKEYFDDGTKLLDKREKDVKKSLKIEENSFKDLMTTYDTALKQLSIKTGDLMKDLENQEAIVVVQSKKVEDLRKRYEDLAYIFGVTASETIKAREQFENARVELENMANTVSQASQKIAEDINKFQKTVMDALKERYTSQLQLQEESIKSEIDNLEKWKDESILRINTVYDAKIKSIDDELKALDEAEKEKERKEKDNEDLEKINKLKTAISFEHDDYNKAQLGKELERAIADRSKRLEKQALEDKKQSLKNQRDTIEEKKKNEIKNITDIYTTEKTSYENRLSELKKFYDEKTKETSLQAESEKMIMKQNQNEIIELLHSYSKEYKLAGSTLGEQLVEGFKPKIQEIKDMISSINKEIASARDNALQTQSEARSITNNNIVNNANKTSNFNVNVQGSTGNRDIENTINRLAFTI